jgi:ribonuclease BN (tRNA processing enzyme)
MLKKILFVSMCIIFINAPAYASNSCGATGLWLQVLGSGGPELDDGRASTSYLIWQEGKARLLIDMGTGSLSNFEQSGASLNDLDAIMLSHLHVDHVNDLPALVKASFFTGRERDLPVLGPASNPLMPSTTDFVQGLFGPAGVYRYLSGFVDGTASYRLRPQNIDTKARTESLILNTPRFRLIAVPVHHGPLPALAWRVEIKGKLIVFSGDMNNDNNTLVSLAKNADLLVAHNVIPETATGIARNLHMPPSVIGQIAGKAEVKQLLLSHRMKRTLGKEKNATELIRQNYKGPLQFADDLQCFKL